MGTKQNIRHPEPWDKDDIDGNLTHKLAAIEAQKAGYQMNDKSWDTMTRGELLNERTELRRIVNDQLAKSDKLRDSGDADGSEKALKIAEEIARWSQLANRQIELNEIAAEHKRGGLGQMVSASGKRLEVLGKSDRFADAVSPGRDGLCQFGFGEYVSAMVRGTDRLDVRNALSEGTDSAGGYTVPKKLMGDIIDRMRARTAVIQAGAMTVPLETQTTTIARIASDPTAAWRLEAGAVAESDPTFDAVTFNARSLAVLVKVSRELLDDSANIDQALAAAFAGAMAVELDRVAMFGSGTAPEPRGIFNQTNVNSVSMGTNGAQITGYGQLLDGLYELQLDNAAPPTGMIMHPRTARTLNGLVDTTGQPLIIPPALSDISRLITTSVPIDQTQGTASDSSTVLMGDFTQLLIGVRQEMRIEVLRELFAGNHQYAFVCHLRADIAVAHPGSFCKVVGILP